MGKGHGGVLLVYFHSTWTERNKIEHGSATKEESNARLRCKLVEKINWLHNKVKDCVNEFGETINVEELETIPLANLEIMEVQLSRIKLNKKLDHLCGGRGDLQDVGP
jgi:hypothetical protein